MIAPGVVHIFADALGSRALATTGSIARIPRPEDIGGSRRVSNTALLARPTAKQKKVRVKVKEQREQRLHQAAAKAKKQAAARAKEADRRVRR